MRLPLLYEVNPLESNVSEICLIRISIIFYKHSILSILFVQVKTERYFGIEKVWIGEARVRITDPERTLLDGLSMPQYCGDFAKVLHAFEVRGDNPDVQRIIEYACKLDAATAKRLGWALELQNIDPALLEPLLKLPIKGYRKLDPTGPRKKSCNRH